MTDKSHLQSSDSNQTQNPPWILTRSGLVLVLSLLFFFFFFCYIKIQKNKKLPNFEPPKTNSSNPNKVHYSSTRSNNSLRVNNQNNNSGALSDNPSCNQSRSH